MPNGLEPTDVRAGPTLDATNHAAVGWPTDESRRREIARALDSWRHVGIALRARDDDGAGSLHNVEHDLATLLEQDVTMFVEYCLLNDRGSPSLLRGPIVLRLKIEGSSRGAVVESVSYDMDSGMTDPGLLKCVRDQVADEDLPRGLLDEIEDGQLTIRLGLLDEEP